MRWWRPAKGDEIFRSEMYSDSTFFKAFINDLTSCKTCILIESPFITTSAADRLLPIFAKMRSRNVSITVNTRQPTEHNGDNERQALEVISKLQDIGVVVLYTGRLHRKIAIIDDEITWEGSLNILSHNKSCEFMRRITSREIAYRTKTFIGLGAY